MGLEGRVMWPEECVCMRRMIHGCDMLGEVIDSVGSNFHGIRASLD